MRLIDADALAKVKFHGYPEIEITPSDVNAEAYKRGWNDAIDAIIESAPSIDAVPVIRCKDCKWWDEKEDSPYGYCMAMKHGYFSSNWEIGIYRTYKGDWYCADAERKNDETDYRKE